MVRRVLGSVFIVLLLGIFPVRAEISGNYYASNAGAMRIGAATDTCVAGITGATRYNAAKQTLEVCIGTSWIGVAGWSLNDMTGGGFDTAKTNYSTAFNMFLGVNSGLSYSSGSYNIAVGQNTLADMTNASYNTGFGSEALPNLTTGSYNTCLGALSGDSITTGNYNICAGWVTLSNIVTSGSYNIAIGSNAYNAPASSSISDNVIIGHWAFDSWSAASGSPNTAVGSHNLKLLTTGNENTAFGAQGIMQNITTAQYNTGFGFYMMMDNLNTECCNTGFGTGALRMVNGTSNVGVGGGDAWSGTLFNVSGYSNAAIGSRAFNTLTSGYESVAIGANAGDTLAGGAMGVYVGYDADANANNYNNAVAIGYNAQVLGGNRIRVGDASVTLISGQVGFTTYSDRRAKTDIEESDLGLAFVLGLRPVSYRMNEGNGRLDYGFIAQDIEKLLAGREANMISVDNDERGTYSLRSSDLIAPIVKAVQEQASLIEAQESQIATQKAELEKLKAEIVHEE
jgi:hypothetical protein